MWCAFVHTALLVVFASLSFAQMEQVIAHPWMKGTSGWSGDVTAPNTRCSGGQHGPEGGGVWGGRGRGAGGAGVLEGTGDY